MTNNTTLTMENPLGVQKISKLFLKFALPSVVAMVVSSLYNVVDQIFIGLGVGFLGNGATNVSFPFVTICLAISLLIGVGSATLFSLSLGKNEEETASKVVLTSLIFSIIVGILYTVLAEIFVTPLLLLFGSTKDILPYAVDYVVYSAIGFPFLIYTNVSCNLIRADGSPRYSMICMLIGAVVNTILDPIFIFAFNMGVKGAAIATTISQIISFIPAFLYLFKFKLAKINLKKITINFKIFIKSISLGASNCLNQLAMLLVQIVMNNSLAYYGELSKFGSDIPLSAFGVAIKINSIFISVFIGINQGTQPIIGYNYGAKKFDRVKQAYKISIIYCAIISLIAFITFQTIPKQLVSLFGSGNALYMEFAVMVMKTFLFTILINGVQLVSANFFASIGKPVKGIILTLSRQCFFFIPILLILPIFFGINGICYTAPLSDVLSFSLTMTFIFIEFKKLKTSESYQHC